MAMRFSQSFTRSLLNQKKKKKAALKAVPQIKPDFAFQVRPPASAASQLPAGILDLLSVSIRVLVFSSYLWNPLLNREINWGRGWDTASVRSSCSSGLTLFLRARGAGEGDWCSAALASARGAGLERACVPSYVLWDEESTPQNWG